MHFSQLKYERPDIAKLSDEIRSLVALFSQAANFEEQDEIFEKILLIRNNVATMMSVCEVRHTVDTRDEFYEKENDYFDENMPLLDSVLKGYYEALDSSRFIKEHKQKRGEHLFNLAKVKIKAISEQVLEDMVEENRLASEYTKLISSAKIPFDGRELTLSMLVPFMTSKDRDVRQKATDSYYGFMASNLESFDDIYDKLVKVRDSIAGKLGFDNFVDLGYMRMERTDYTSSEVEKYRNGIRKYITPIASKLKELQKERLGLDKLRYFDNNYLFPDGNPEPQGDEQWVVDKAQKMYSELSDSIGGFFNLMTEGGYMDLGSKEGKAPGGYCTFLRDYKMPFIFSNFNGTLGDVTVLTHEVGHAYQIYMNEHNEIEYQWPTSEAAEIHSMSMEFLTYPWMEKFFEKDVHKFFVAHLSNSITFLPYAATVDHFQHFVYENPQANSSERRAKWRELERMYQPYLNYEGNEYLEEGGYWQKQIHIYQAPFYYIDYALAQLCAFQFLFKANENRQKAWESYEHICRIGGSLPFTGIIKEAGLLSPFDEENIKQIASDIETYLDKLM